MPDDFTGGYYPPMPPALPPFQGGGYTPGSGGGCSGGNCGCASCSGSSSNSSSLNSINSMNSSVQSWYDLPVQTPADPRILIANASLGTLQGTFVRATNFTASTWVASPFALNGTVTCASLHSDDALTVADAAQWNFAHQGANVAATNALPLRKVIFLRGGTEWEMSVGIDLGGLNYTDLMLSFRDNAATPGDFTGGGQGTIPAIRFVGILTGVQTLKVSLKMLGTFTMAIKALETTNNSLFEMEWVVVP